MDLELSDKGKKGKKDAKDQCKPLIMNPPLKMYEYLAFVVF